MITKIVFKFPYGDKDEVYNYAAVSKALENLGYRMNRNDFCVYSGPMWDNDPTCGMEEELSVGNVIGHLVEVFCDDMFEDLVMNEVRSTMFKVGWYVD